MRAGARRAPESFVRSRAPSHTSRRTATAGEEGFVMFIARTRLVCLVVVAAPVLAPIRRARAAPPAPRRRGGRDQERQAHDGRGEGGRAPVHEAGGAGAGRRRRRRPAVRAGGIPADASRGHPEDHGRARSPKMRALVRSRRRTIRRSPTSSSASGELYVEKQRYFFDQAHALDQKIFELPPAQRGPLQAEQQTLRARGADVAAGGGQGVHRRDPVPEVRAHGRGAVPPRGAADQRRRRTTRRASSSTG